MIYLSTALAGTLVVVIKNNTESWDLCSYWSIVLKLGLQKQDQFTVNSLFQVATSVTKELRFWHPCRVCQLSEQNSFIFWLLAAVFIYKKSVGGLKSTMWWLYAALTMFQLIYGWEDRQKDRQTARKSRDPIFHHLIHWFFFSLAGKTQSEIEIEQSSSFCAHTGILQVTTTKSKLYKHLNALSRHWEILGKYI